MIIFMLYDHDFDFFYVFFVFTSGLQNPNKETHIYSNPTELKSFYKENCKNYPKLLIVMWYKILIEPLY